MSRRARALLEFMTEGVERAGRTEYPFVFCVFFCLFGGWVFTGINLQVRRRLVWLLSEILRMREKGRIIAGLCRSWTYAFLPFGCQPLFTPVERYFARVACRQNKY